MLFSGVHTIGAVGDASRVRDVQGCATAVLRVAGERVIAHIELDSAIRELHGERFVEAPLTPPTAVRPRSRSTLAGVIASIS